MSERPVLYDTDGLVAWLRLNRPHAMNSINAALLAELEAALDAVEEDDDVRVAVITGTGFAFCAGADLKAVAPTGEVDADAMMPFIKRAAAVIERIPAMNKPVLAAVNGLAVAGELELAMACDVIIAAQSALIGDAHANFGVLPGAGGAVRLARIVGPSVARRLAFTGDMLPAEQLVPLGLVNEVVADDQLEKRVGELATNMAAKSPLVLAKLKRLIVDGLEVPLSEALLLEHDALAAHAQSQDIREGLAAFREKRPPVYVGR